MERLVVMNPEDILKYPWTDIGAGMLFADFYKETLRYVPERKSWFFYEGGIWQQDVGGLKAMKLCMELANLLHMYALKITDEQANTLPTEQQAYRQSALQLKALYDCAQDCSFQIFCQQLPGVSAAEAKQMNDLWIVYSSGSLSDTMVDALDFAGEEKENIREIAMGDMQIFQSAIPQHDATSSGDDSSDSKSSGILEKSFTFKSELGSDIGGENSLISATEDSETNDNSADSDIRAESKVPDESDTVGWCCC